MKKGCDGVYLAGPMLGLTQQEAFGWREEARTALLRAGLRVYSPSAAGLMDRDRRYWASDGAMGEAQYRLARENIERCETVLVNLREAKRVSIGTCVEIGIAAALDRRIILVMERQGNVHEHPFLFGGISAHYYMLDLAIADIIRDAAYG